MKHHSVEIPSRHPADDQAIECSRRALERSSMRLSALIGVRPQVRIFGEKELDARATSRESAVAVLDCYGVCHWPNLPAVRSTSLRTLPVGYHRSTKSLSHASDLASQKWTS